MDAGYLEERALVENFARRAVEIAGDECVAVVFMSWTQGHPPEGIVSPGSNGMLDMTELRGMLRGRSIVIAPCTFKFAEEETAANRIVSQLSQLHDTCVLAAHLLTPDVRLDRECTERVGLLLQRILQTRVDDVLLDPDLEPTALKLKIRMAKHAWRRNHQHFTNIVQEDPSQPTAAEVRHLEAVHHKLLWEDIPRELMPHFHAMDAGLRESENAVGEYTLIAKMPSVTGVVWEAQNREGVKVAVKCRDKQQIFTPGEVEGINRELRFLKGYVRHPNIVRLRDFLHSPKNIYIILEFAGKKNLGQHLADLPGNRMPPNDCLTCFQHIASALAHCHDKDITHRSVSLEHIVLNAEDTDSPLCAKLVDFHTATTAKPTVTFRSICGKLPCIAPEVLLGDIVSYVPMPADCWSVGVVMLEMAGGMGSLVQATNLTEEEMELVFTSEHHRYSGANKIRSYLITGGNHEGALACMGGVRHNEILEILRVVLREPEDRPQLCEFGIASGDLEVTSVVSRGVSVDRI